MSECNEVYNSFLEIMKKYPACLFGTTCISWSEFGDKYKCAVVIAVPHKKIMTMDNYAEKELENLISEARKECEEIIGRIADFCRKQNIKYYIPPAAQQSEESMTALFSYKYAAVNAGLGWIGKNDLFITEKYGPRVRLSAILIDHEFPIGKPVERSKCDDKCNFCVEACPYNFIKGIQWDISKKRDDILDYHSCNAVRSVYIKKHGRKNACGLCMVSCPIGTAGIENSSM
jgi:epoxyqueuosine reductase QueG